MVVPAVKPSPMLSLALVNRLFWIAYHAYFTIDLRTSMILLITLVLKIKNNKISIKL